MEWEMEGTEPTTFSNYFTPISKVIVMEGDITAVGRKACRQRHHKRMTCTTICGRTWVLGFMELSQGSKVFMCRASHRQATPMH